MTRTLVLLGTLLTVAARDAVPACSNDPQSVPTQATPALVATHATRGVVKSVDATSLVLTRSAIGKKEIAFVMNPATRREGCIAVGATVEVRYRTGEKQQIATAIRVQDE